jgi:hypothetical protein
MNDVELDLKNMGVKRRKTGALTRKEWTSVVREAKPNLKGCSVKKKKTLYIRLA